MRSKHFTHPLFFFWNILFFIASTATVSNAQTTDPSTWNSFVHEKANKIVNDTFRIITFSDPKDISNWEYNVTGNHKLIRPDECVFEDTGGSDLLQLTPESRFSVKLDHPEGYTNIKIRVAYAFWNLSPGENLLISSERKENTLKKLVYISPTEKGYSCSFKISKDKNKPEYIQLKDDPSTLQFDFTKASGTSAGGYYLLDSVYAFGNTREYSLYTGTGNWHTTAGWSHQPPARWRSALINGDIAVDLPTTCEQLYLGKGTVHINGGNSLQVRNMQICNEEASFSSAGEVNITDRVTLHRSFPQKGKWYFISLPFDLYADGIDPAFKQKDDTPNAGGNYFYLYHYNGEKRAQNQLAEGNWEVIPESVDKDCPIMEKGKGYLIALDEKADTQTINFSSRQGDIPTDWGRNGSLAISLSTDNEQEAEQGWALCGNPLPCPLPLSVLARYDVLDGYAYIYCNGQYEAYSLTSDYVLPPYSAFFLKTQKSIEIEVEPALPTKSQKLLYTAEPLSMIKAEPRSSGSPVSLASSPVTHTSKSFLNTNSLFIEDLLMPGFAYIWDLGGRLRWMKEVGAGSSVIRLPLSLPSGIYVVTVESPSYRGQHIFNWNQSSLK